MSNHEEKENYWREEDSYGSSEMDDDEIDEELEAIEDRLISSGCLSEEDVQRIKTRREAIRDLDFGMFLTDAEQERLDRNDPDAVARACELAKSRARALKRGEPVDADILANRPEEEDDPDGNHCRGSQLRITMSSVSTLPHGASTSRATIASAARRRCAAGATATIMLRLPRDASAKDR